MVSGGASEKLGDAEEGAGHPRTASPGGLATRNAV